MASKILDQKDAEHLRRIANITNQLFEATDPRLIVALKKDLERATRLRVRALGKG